MVSLNFTSQKIVSMKTRSTFIKVMAIVITAFVVGCKSSSAASENRIVKDNIYGLILKSNAQLILTQGNEPSVRIEGDERSVSAIQTVIENGALVVKGRNDVPVTIYVTINSISLIE